MIMARVKIDIPDKFHFQTEITVRIGDLNYGGHVGNDVFLTLLHEIRVRFLKAHGFSEMDVCGAGLIMSDAALIYKAQAFYGMKLWSRLAVCDYSRAGCDMVYLLTDGKDGKEILQAKTGMVFYDYGQKKVMAVPSSFKDLFSV